MSYWNHRVVRYTEPNGTFSFGIHEAFYEDEKVPHSISENAEPVIAESGNDMQQTLEWMQQALTKPLLDYKTHDEISKRAAIFEMNETARKARDGLRMAAKSTDDDDLRHAMECKQTPCPRCAQLKVNGKYESPAEERKVGE